MELTDKLFEIVRGPSPRKTKSITMPAAPCLIGTSFIEDFANPGVAKLADGTQPAIGFITRDLITGVPLPTIGELAGGMIALPAVSPFSTGLDGSTEDADEYICEGPDYIYSAGGASDLTAANVAAGVPLSFRGGKTSKAVSGDYSEYVVQEVLTPLNIGNAYGTGYPRIRARRVAGRIV